MASTTTVNLYRVTCPEYTREARNLAAARRMVSDIEGSGHCMYPHRVEEYVGDGEWVAVSAE